MSAVLIGIGVFQFFSVALMEAVNGLTGRRNWKAGTSWLFIRIGIALIAAGAVLALVT